jgi:predicted nicotinamide N-methyase
MPAGQPPNHPTTQPPRIHSTPPEAVKERVRETVLVGGATFKIDRPGGSDLLFDHPAVRAAYAADEYIPYWAELWTASRMLAKAILREPWERYPKPPGGKLEALEVGCGLGLAGIAALSRGLRVTFSDIDELAVKFAAANARLNGFTDFATAAIDLRSPPPGLSTPVLLGADLLYEPRMVEPVAAFIAAVLAPGGVCLLADPDRISARPFRWLCQNAGLTVEAAFARAGEPGGERTRGSVYRITRP